MDVHACEQCVHMSVTSIPCPSPCRYMTYIPVVGGAGRGAAPLLHRGIARALHSGRSGIFTMIVPDLENGYYARNLKLLIPVSQYDNAKELRQIQELHSSKCDRFFVCSSHNSALAIPAGA